MGQKIIFLVRHGHYASNPATADPLEGSLTNLGREQAERVAQRLHQFPIDRIHSSSMRRAAETACAVASRFPKVTLGFSELLWEFRWKIFTEAAQSLVGEELEQVIQTKQRITTAFEQYFTPSSTEDTQHEVLVCHGNLIRYFVCRALQIPPETFLNMESANCGISTVSVTANGGLMLIAYNDVGHLPIATQTYIRYVPASSPVAVP